MTTRTVNLRELIKRSFYALRYPRQAFQAISPEESINPVMLTPLLFIWGGVFIILHFFIAQSTNIFQYHHSIVTIPGMAVYGYLLWRLGSLTFFGVSKFLRKNLTIQEAEIGGFYLWFVWAIMPFFDLPHRIFGLPLISIGGAGAHISWLFAFPYLAIFAFYFLKKIGLESRREWYAALLLSASVPFLGRYVVEQIPLWLHFQIQEHMGKTYAPGFHFASLVVVLLTLVLVLFINSLVKDWRRIWPSVSFGVFSSFFIIVIWVQLLPFSSYIRFSGLPAGFVENVISGVNATGNSRYTHSFTWTSSDIESGTGTHGPQATSSYWADTYSGALDFDFNPSVHEINYVRITVHFTAATVANSASVSGPEAKVCLRGSAGANWYCSGWSGELPSGQSTTTFIMDSSSMTTFNANDGVATSSAAWTELINGMTQDDTDVMVESYTAGTEDANTTPPGDTIAFDSVIVSFNYRDTGELAVAMTTSTTISSSTSLINVEASRIASSSLPAGTYLVLWSSQIAQTSGTGSFVASAELARVSSTAVTLGQAVPYMKSASSSNPLHGDNIGGFWLGDLSGGDILQMKYKSQTTGGTVYMGDRFIMAIRLDGTLTKNVDYWTTGQNDAGTGADLLNAATSSADTVITNNRTFLTATSSYLLFAYTEATSSATYSQSCIIKFLVNSSSLWGAFNARYPFGSTSARYNFIQVSTTSIPGVTSSLTITEQSFPVSNKSCSGQRSRILAIRADIFEPLGYDINTSFQRQSATTTYAIGAGLASFAPLSTENIIVLGNAILSTATSAYSAVSRVSSTLFATNQVSVQVSTSSPIGTHNSTVLMGGLMQTADTSTRAYYFQLKKFPNPDNVNVVAANDTVIVWPVKLARYLTQSGYRWYQNLNATSTGAVLAATNTAATAPAQGTPFRLRLLLHNNSSTLPAKSQPFKLQLAAQSSTCDTSFSGESYSDVGRSSGAIRFYDNSGVSDATAITSSSTDPTNGTSTVVVQSYEEANSFVAIASTSFSNHDAMWDFSLVDNSATAGTSYCFRAVKIDNTNLDAYSVIPEIRTAGATPVIGSITINSSTDIVLLPATTTRVYASSTITDADGAGDMIYATSTFFRSGVGSSCTANTLNCYQVASSSCSLGSSTSTVACYADIWYNAQATGNASSSFSSEKWQATITVTDKQGLNISSTSAATVHIGLLTAIDAATSTINYGSVTVGQTTGGTNQTLGLINYGNTSTTFKVSGTNITVGSNSVTVDNIHYASSTFTYGNLEQSLSTTPTAVSGVTISAPPMTSSWVQDAGLAQPRTVEGSALYKGYVYVYGGLDTNDNATTSVFYAPLSPTGTITSWSSTTALPAAFSSFGFTAYNGRLYQFGGAETSSVNYGTINSGGGVSSWTNTTALPVGGQYYSNMATARYGAYVYLLGGYSSSSLLENTTTVFYGLINSNGTISNWSSTTALPTARSEGSALAYNGYLYYFGGNSLVLGTHTTTVIYALINTTGSIGSWSETTKVPTQTTQGVFRAAQDGGQVYLLSNGTTTTLFTPMNSNGSLGPWSQGTAMPSSATSFAEVYNGQLYSFTGTNGGFLNTTKREDIRHIPVSSHDTFWGLKVPFSTASGSYTGTITLTSVFAQ